MISSTGEIRIAPITPKIINITRKTVDRGWSGGFGDFGCFGSSSFEDSKGEKPLWVDPRSSAAWLDGTSADIRKNGRWPCTGV